MLCQLAFEAVAKAAMSTIKKRTLYLPARTAAPLHHKCNARKCRNLVRGEGMSLEKIFYLSQSVAAITVVASIVYLPQQVRQSERIHRAMVQQGRVDRASHRSMIVASPEPAGVVQKGMAGSKPLTRESLTSGH